MVHRVVLTHRFHPLHFDPFSGGGAAAAPAAGAGGAAAAEAPKEEEKKEESEEEDAVSGCRAGAAWVFSWPLACSCHAKVLEGSRPFPRATHCRTWVSPCSTDNLAAVPCGRCCNLFFESSLCLRYTREARSWPLRDCISESRCRTAATKMFMRGLVSNREGQQGLRSAFRHTWRLGISCQGVLQSFTPGATSPAPGSRT